MTLTDPATIDALPSKASGFAIFPWLIVAAVVVLTLLPVVNIVWALATLGCDNLCNDYLAYVGIVDHVLSGTYDWSNFLHDTFYRTHCVTLPVLLHIANAYFFRFSVYPELYFGVALALIRLLLWQRTLSANLDRRLSLCLWPLLSLLVFSDSQMPVFAYGDASIPIGLALLGFSLGAWGLVRLKNAGLALSAMLVGGLIASFSWGNGLVSWLVFLLSLLLLGFRKPWHYAVWIAGLLVSLLPYIFFLVLPRVVSSQPAYPGTTVVSLFKLRFIINALGWPFANGIAGNTVRLPDAQAVAWIGLALAACGLILLWRNRTRMDFQYAVPAILFMLYGLLSLWQISVFRSLIAPWYTAVAMPFWAGLLGLSFHLSRNRNRFDSGNRDSRAVSVWSALVVLLIAIAYLRSNLTFEDKTDAFNVRSPASASISRNYTTAPTYGEKYIFQWLSGNPGMLERLEAPLRKHRLSVFAPDQQWALQGDWALNTVKLSGTSAPADVFWTEGTTVRDRRPWSHYKHLNLFLSSPSKVAWTVNIPSSARSVVFETATAPNTSSSPPGKSSGLLCRILINSGSGFSSDTEILRAGDKNWHNIKVPLDNYAGQTVTLTLSADSIPPGRQTRVVFRYPHISIAGAKTDTSLSEVKPSNTDLDTNSPQPGPEDIDATRLKPDQSLAINPTEVSDFWIRIAEDEGVAPRAVSVKINTSGRRNEFILPLLADSKPHLYTYPLRLLELQGNSRITAVAVEPLMAGADKVHITGYGFIRKHSVPILGAPASSRH